MSDSQSMPSEPRKPLPEDPSAGGQLGPLPGDGSGSKSGSQFGARSVHHIGSSVVPVGSLASPEDRTVISSKPPAPAPSHRTDSSPTELGRLLEGERLDHFELEEFIGGGGMGAVFRGIDTQLGRTVAIKVLSKRDGGDAEMSRRFKNEAQSAARLDNEYIARVYYVGQDRGWHYIVFEYIDGENIRDMVTRVGPLPITEVVHYLVQIAEALNHAISRDVVHRDIKPSNVLITKGRRAKLVDMGLARLHQVETSQADITASGVTLGTFDYISPEQARDPRVADARSDIYSLGCTTYYMLTGRPPFPEGTVLQKLLQHQGDEPSDPEGFRSDIPPVLSEVLRKMLVKNPTDRFQSPAELLEALSGIAERLGLGTRSAETAWIEPAQNVSPSWERLLPWLIPVAVLIAVVVAIELAGNIGGTQEPPLPRPLLSSNGSDGNAPVMPPEGSSPTSSAVDEIPPDDKSVTDESSAEPGVGQAEDTTTPSASPSEPKARPEDDPPSTGTDDKKPEQKPPVKPNAEAGAGDALMPVNENPTASAAAIVLGPGTAEPRTFGTIAAALRDAATGDVIELRFNGVREERPWRIEKQKITIRAAEGFRPVIRFTPSGTDPVLQPRNMVTVSGGELTMINMQLQLDLPPHLQSDRWSLFHIVLADRLRLDRTIATVRNAAADGSAYHQEVSFIKVDAPLGTDMVIAEARSRNHRTSIELRNCILRGEADVLAGNLLNWTDFTWENGLLATSERLVSLGSDDFRHAEQDNTGELRIDIQHLTADMRQGMGAVYALGEMADLFPMRIEVSDTIILIGETPLFDFVGSGSEKSFREKLHWSADQNFYQGVGVFWRIDDQSTDDLAEMTWTQWQAFWGPGSEATERAAAVGWALLPERTKPYWQRTVANYALDLEDANNPAIGSSTDGSTNGGMLPELLPVVLPLKELQSTTAPLSSTEATPGSVETATKVTTDELVSPAAFESPAEPEAQVTPPAKQSN